MTVNEKIRNALAGFALPVTADFFGGGEEEYVTFNYADDRAAAFADDVPILVEADLQIHYFLPADKNYLKNKKEIRKALFGAGFTYPAVTEFTEPDSNVRHIIFECRIENDDETED